MKLKTIAATVCAMFACGCVCTSTGGFEVAVREGDPVARATIDDYYFSQRLIVQTTGFRRTSSGLASAQILVRNKEHEDVPIQYKFTFFDGEGMEVQPGARPWEQTTIHGGEAVTLAAVAPDKSVVRFVARVRRVK
ncbi:MAG: YcfL family protein [Kiritimatiellae bacterium]|nr:YcfL family protein [Kiritimatiellia bacterium]